MGKPPCFCCRPDCYDCNPDLWMAAVNADFAANAERYQREYDEAEAVPITEDQIKRMLDRAKELLEEHVAAAERRKKIIEGN